MHRIRTPTINVVPEAERCIADANGADMHPVADEGGYFCFRKLTGNQEITMVRKPIIAISGYTISTVHSPLNPSLVGVLTFNDQLGRGSQSGLVLVVNIQLPAPDGKILATGREYWHYHRRGRLAAGRIEDGTSAIPHDVRDKGPKGGRIELFFLVFNHPSDARGPGMTAFVEKKELNLTNS